MATTYLESQATNAERQRQEGESNDDLHLQLDIFEIRSIRRGVYDWPMIEKDKEPDKERKW